MIDIEFYQKVALLKRSLMTGPKISRSIVENALDAYRSPVPVVYNIETTNACNMRCEMCPRTTMMTRPIKTMGMLDFKRVINQLQSWTGEQWQRWKLFVWEYYHVSPEGMSENHFFLY